MVSAAFRKRRAVTTGNLMMAISIFSRLRHVRGPSLSRRAKTLAGLYGSMAIAECARWIAAAWITSMWPTSATSATCFG